MSGVDRVATIACQSCGNHVVSQQATAADPLVQAQAQHDTGAQNDTDQTHSKGAQIQLFLQNAFIVRDALNQLHSKTFNWVDTFMHRSPSQWARLTSSVGQSFQLPDIADPKYSDRINHELRVLVQVSLYTKFLEDQDGLATTPGDGPYSPLTADLSDLKEKMTRLTCSMRRILSELTDTEISSFVRTHAQQYVMNLSSYRSSTKRRIVYIALDTMITVFNSLTISVGEGSVEIV